MFSCKGEEELRCKLHGIYWTGSRLLRSSRIFQSWHAIPYSRILLAHWMPQDRVWVYCHYWALALKFCLFLSLSTWHFARFRRGASVLVAEAQRVKPPAELLTRPPQIPWTIQHHTCINTTTRLSEWSTLQYILRLSILNHIFFSDIA